MYGIFKHDILKENKRMRKLHGLLGNASTINPKEAKKELENILLPEESIEASFKLIRDLIVFTDKRLILVDKQGITGKKIEFHSILYNSITHYTVETAGTFDLDSELKIWVGGATDPLIHKLFRKDSSIFDIQKILAVMTLS